MDINNLLNAVKYGLPYQGDLNRDLCDVLETVIAKNYIMEEIKDSLSEVTSQLPDEDHLNDVIDELIDVNKLKKAEIIENVNKAKNMLINLNTNFGHASEYVNSIVKDITKKYNEVFDE